MAFLALPVMGAMAGSAVGGAFLGISAMQWGLLIGNIAYMGLASRVKTRVTIGEANVQTTTTGMPRPLVFGTAMVKGNVIDEGKIWRREIVHTSGGKGTPKQTQIEEQWFGSYAIRLCEGPVKVGILMAKKDGVVVFDARPESGFDNAANLAFLDTVTFYPGDEEQLPDPTLEAIHGVGNAFAHRGTCYIVHRNDDLTQRRGSLPQWEYLLGNGIVTPPPPDNRLSHLVSVAAALYSGGVQALPDMNPSDDTRPTHESYFSEFGASALLSFLSYTSGTAPGDTGMLGPKVLPIDVARSYFFEAHNSWGGLNDASAFHLEFLNASGVVVAWMRSQGYVGPPEDVSYSGARHYLRYGTPTSGTLTAPTHGYHTTHGTIRFEAGVFKFISDELTNRNLSFDLPCNALSIRSVRISACQAKSTSTSVGAGAYVRMFRLAVPYTPPVVEPPPEGTEQLSTIISTIHERCGMPAPQVEDLEYVIVDGLVLASADYNGGDAIETLRATHRFDRSVVDRQCHYFQRGKPVVATITEEDLVEEPDESGLEDKTPFPRKLHLFHTDPDLNYESVPATSTIDAPAGRGVGEKSVQTPVVMRGAEAVKVAHILHKILMADAEGEVKLALRFNWLELTGGCNINFTIRGLTRRLRIERIDDANWVRNLVCKVDRAGAYRSNPVFAPAPLPSPPPSTAIGETVLAVLDVPALREQDDSLVMYLAAVGEKSAWRGAAVQRSLDAGATFSDVVPLGAAIIGRLVDPVATASEHFTDTGNVVRVQLLREGHELEPVSDAAFLSGGGAFALAKPDGGWEIMQYRDAEDEGDGLFVLTTLHRGVLDTGPSAHDADAVFVLLSGVTPTPAQSAWLSLDLTHRAPATGTSPEEAAQQTMTYGGHSQREWSVASLALSRAGDMVSGTWAPRHRFGSDSLPVPSANFVGFRVTLDDGSAAVTFDTTAPTFEHDATGMATPLTVSVAALNRITGPGTAVTGEI